MGRWPSMHFWMKPERSKCPKNRRRTLNLWKCQFCVTSAARNSSEKNVRARNAVKAGHTIRRKVDLREIVIHGGLSLSASKVCNVNLKSCDTRVYVYNSSDPFHVLGNFWTLVESKCSAVQLSSLLLIVIGYATVTELDILRTANAVSEEKTFS